MVFEYLNNKSGNVFCLAEDTPVHASVKVYYLR